MFQATTIVAVRRDGQCAMAGDGQVTMGEKTVMKHTANKVKKIYNDKVLIGFAGSVADAFTLSEKFEGKLEEYSGNVLRASVEVAKEWRSDKALRKMEALLLAMDLSSTFLISGNGEVIEPDDGIIAIGSGGNYALSAGKAMLRHTDLTAKDIALESLKIASEICVYTNDNIRVLEL